MKDECIMDHQNVATEQRKAAKARMVAGMLRGQPWQTAAATAGVRTSRTTAYRLREKVRMQGENGLSDGRHGHPSKLRAPIQQWLEVYCRGAPGASGLMVQAALHEQCGLTVSVRHLNRIRAARGVGRDLRRRARQDAGGKCGTNRAA